MKSVRNQPLRNSRRHATRSGGSDSLGGGKSPRRLQISLLWTWAKPLAPCAREGPNRLRLKSKKRNGMLHFLLMINENWTIIGCGFPISSTGDLDERAKVEFFLRDRPLCSSGSLSHVCFCACPFTFLQLSASALLSKLLSRCQAFQVPGGGATRSSYCLILTVIFASRSMLIS